MKFSAVGVRARRAIPRGVWALGFVSLFMDVSSGAIHALLPVYMTTVLGVSALTIGVFEGVALAIASIVKVFSGMLSDWLGKRKALAAFGYGLAAITKPVFALAESIEWVMAARFIDRIGKGVRGAPRDALVADFSPKELRGASYGLHQSIETIGSFVGPALAIGMMWLTADNFRVVFGVAAIPAFVSLALILFVVREPESPGTAHRARAPLRLRELRRLRSSYWVLVVLGALFTMARFSEAFLVLRGQSLGLPVALAPVVFVVLYAAYAVSAFPAGALSDRIDRSWFLFAGLALLITADLVLAYASDIVGLAIGVILWGAHMGFTQGVLAAFIADTAPADLRGTAFGFLNLLTGVALLCASILAGALWDAIGPHGTFLTGAVFAALALMGLLCIRSRLSAQSSGGTSGSYG